MRGQCVPSAALAEIGVVSADEIAEVAGSKFPEKEKA